MRQGVEADNADWRSAWRFSPLMNRVLSLTELSVKALRLSIIAKFEREIILLAATNQWAKRHPCLSLCITRDGIGPCSNRPLIGSCRPAPIPGPPPSREPWSLSLPALPRADSANN
jgi:hypothetical protein